MSRRPWLIFIRAYYHLIPGKIVFQEAWDDNVIDHGITIHQVDEGIDTPIILQQSYKNRFLEFEKFKAKGKQIEENLRLDFLTLIGKIIMQNYTVLVQEQEISKNIINEAKEFYQLNVDKVQLVKIFNIQTNNNFKKIIKELLASPTIKKLSKISLLTLILQSRYLLKMG